MGVIKIQIQNKLVEFESYSHGTSGWFTKLEDYFSFQSIDGVEYFVKRATSRPSGWDLLNKLKTQKPIHQPKIYATAIIREQNQDVFYYFTQKLKGRTLKEILQDNKKVDLQKILDQIYSSLSSLHRNNFWFNDLNEENIFVSDSGNYYLIDLDSCWRNNIQPNPTTNKEGGIINKEFAVPVLNFYQKILNKKEYKFSDIKGTNLNYLQLLFLLTRIRYYQEEKKEKNISYIGNTFRNISWETYLHTRHPNLSKAVFSRAHNEGEKFNSNVIKSLGNAIISEIKLTSNQSKTRTQKQGSATPDLTHKPYTSSSQAIKKRVNLESGQKGAKVPKERKRATSKKKAVPKRESNNLWIKGLLFFLAFASGIWGGNYSSFSDTINRGDFYFEGSNQNYDEALSFYERSLKYKFVSLDHSKKQIRIINQKSIKYYKKEEKRLDSAFRKRNLNVAASIISSIKTSPYYINSIKEALLLQEVKLNKQLVKQEIRKNISSGKEALIHGNIEQAVQSLQTAWDSATYYNFLNEFQALDANLNDAKRQNLARINEKLFNSCTNNDFQGVLNALAAGADVNQIRGEESYPVILQAIATSSIEIIKLLINEGADPNDRRGCYYVDHSPMGSPLTVAAGMGKLDIVKFLIEEKNVNIDLVGTECGEENKRTALGAAVSQGHFNVVVYLLEKHADPNIKQYEDEKTALMEACKKGNKSIVEELIRKNANVFLKDSNGKDAYDYTTNEEIKKILQTKGLGTFRFYDDFDWEDDFLTIDNDIGKAYFRHGEYILKIKKNIFTSLIDLDALDINQDFSLKANFKWESKEGKNPMAGIIFSSVGHSEYVRFGLFSDTEIKVSRLYNGEWQKKLYIEKDDSRGTDRVKMEIKKENQEIKFYINGLYVGRINQDFPMGNLFGFYLQGISTSIKVDNLEITGLKK